MTRDDEARLQEAWDLFRRVIADIHRLDSLLSPFVKRGLICKFGSLAVARAALSLPFWDVRKLLDGKTAPLPLQGARE